MEISGLHIQIVVSIIVILSAACLALLCDFLKARSEQLRENLVELRVQREEEQHMISAPTGGAQLRAARARALARMMLGNTTALKPLEKTEAQQVLSEWLAERSRSKTERETREETPVGARAVEVVEVAAPARAGSSLIMEAFLADTLRWDSPAAAPVFEVIQGAGLAELAVPSGMGDAAAFTRLLEDTKPFTGLLISISVDERDEASLRSLTECVAGLLRGDDFGCPAGPDEFIIVCPGERGAQARRRLNDLSERLWDFQLRMLGPSSAVFHWDGADVEREPFAQAVVAARQRMYQTKRGRSTSSIGSAGQRKRAV